MTKAEDVWGGSTSTVETETKPRPTVAAAIQEQLRAKTDEDVKRQERQMGATPDASEQSPMALAVEATKKRIAEADTGAKARALLREMDAIPTSTKLEMKIKAVCRDLVGKHWHAIQQGTPTVSTALEADTKAVARQAQITAPERRAARLEALRRAEGRVFDEAKLTPPVLEFPLSVSPREALLSSRPIRELVACVRTDAIRLQIYELENFEWLNPVDGEQEVRDAIRDAGTDQKLLGELTTKLAAMTGREASDIRQRFRAERTTLRETFEQDARNLIAKAIEALTDLHAQAVTAEKLWLETFNLPHEATLVSRRYAATITELKSRTPSKEFPLPWFGIRDIA